MAARPGLSKIHQHEVIYSIYGFSGHKSIITSLWKLRPDLCSGAPAIHSDHFGAEPHTYAHAIPAIALHSNTIRVVSFQRLLAKFQLRVSNRNTITHTDAARRTDRNG